MDYKSQTIQNYLDDLAARKPAPGGGSVAALVAGLAAGLLSMAANYTLGKNPEKDKDIKNLLSQSESLRKEFIELIDLDVEAYINVSKAKKAGEKEHQDALKNAAEVPLKICVYCDEGLKLCESFYNDANKYLISDLDIAIKLFKSALSSGLINVKINIPYLKDKKFVKKIEESISKLEGVE